MANMEDRIDAFIAEHGLDENAKDDVIDLVNGCFGDYVAHMSKEWLTTPTKPPTKESSTKTKKNKLEDPAMANTAEELTNCTTAILNEYCKNNGLKIGGNKKELSGRVWRHIQGESSEDDTSSRSKPKTTKAAKEKHSCFACNSKGAPCGIAATEEHNGVWFCFRHIDEAEEIIAKKDSESVNTEKAVKTVKAAKAVKAVKAVKASKSTKKKNSSEGSENEEELNSD